MAATADWNGVIARRRDEIIQGWLNFLRAEGALQTGRIKDAELQSECGRVLALVAPDLAHAGDRSPASDELSQTLTALSRSRALQGFTPSETANFVLGLKPALFGAVAAEYAGQGDLIAAATLDATRKLDRLALITIEAYQRSREEVIIRQQREISELSTPVVKLWDGILALPLIGTLDSERTQVVMENLLQSIVDTSAEIAIIDITGVPTVDTLVAQHLLKTVAAARLMGADCVVSGIRPQIAQTMVHLGVELNVVSKASLADALALALQRIGKRVTDVPQMPASPEYVR